MTLGQKIRIIASVPLLGVSNWLVVFVTFPDFFLFVFSFPQSVKLQKQTPGLFLKKNSFNDCSQHVKLVVSRALFCEKEPISQGLKKGVFVTHKCSI